MFFYWSLSTMRPQISKRKFMTIYVISTQSPDRNAPPNVAFAAIIRASIEKFQDGNQFLESLFKSGDIHIFLETNHIISADERQICALWNDRSRTLSVSCLDSLDKPEVLLHVLANILDGLSIVACQELARENLPHILSYSNIAEFILDMSRREYNAFLVRLAFRQQPLITYENYFSSVFGARGLNPVSLAEYYDSIYRSKITQFESEIKKSAELIASQNFDYSQFENTTAKGPVDLKLCDALLRASKIHDEAHALFEKAMTLLTHGSTEVKAVFNAPELLVYSEQVKAMAEAVIAKLNGMRNVTTVPVQHISPTRPPSPRDVMYRRLSRQESFSSLITREEQSLPELPPMPQVMNPPPAAAEVSATAAVDETDVSAIAAVEAAESYYPYGFFENYVAVNSAPAAAERVGPRSFIP